jgi:hypothetical protein
MTDDMSLHRTLLAAAALTGVAVARRRSRPASRPPAAPAVRPRARTVCTNSSVVVACADHAAVISRALTPTRVAVCSVTSAPHCA